MWDLSTHLIRIRQQGFLGSKYNASFIAVCTTSSFEKKSPELVDSFILVLHKIAFQYYPLDLEPISNPFLISWWPLALGDPALFHVSLKTACLDEERAAQKGFQSSEILMADSVALLRRKINSTSLAVQDGTMNSVITLATIEVSLCHISTLCILRLSQYHMLRFTNL